MDNNPFIGVGFHAAGGIAHGSFYAQPPFISHPPVRPPAFATAFTANSKSLAI